MTGFVINQKPFLSVSLKIQQIAELSRRKEIIWKTNVLLMSVTNNYFLNDKVWKFFEVP